MKKKVTSQAGFSFVEILVFVAIVSFLFVAMTSTVISSLQRMQVTEHRLYANRYAEELLEWLRAQKETDWDAFANRDANLGGGTIYCFNDALDFDTATPTWPSLTYEQCNYDGVGTEPPQIFKRYVLLKSVPPDFNQVNVQIRVEWKEGTRFYTAPLNTVFTNIDENVPTPTP